MFGLPAGTVWLVLGFPLFWIAYLIVFMVVSRDWAKDIEHKDEKP